MRDFIEKREDVERRAAMAQARPAPEWIVAKRNEYKTKAWLWSAGPVAVWLLTAGAALIGITGEWGRQWKRWGAFSVLAWGAVDVLFGLAKRAAKYKKAAGILSRAIDTFEASQYADTGVLDTASREAEAVIAGDGK